MRLKLFQNDNLSVNYHGESMVHMLFTWIVLVQLACSVELACRLYIFSVCDVVCQMVLEFCLARWFLSGHDDALQSTGCFLEYFSSLIKGKFMLSKYLKYESTCM